MARKSIIASGQNEQNSYKMEVLVFFEKAIRMVSARGVEPEPEPLGATYFARNRSRSHSDFLALVVPTLEASNYRQTMKSASNGPRAITSMP